MVKITVTHPLNWYTIEQQFESFNDEAKKLLDNSNKEGLLTKVEFFRKQESQSSDMGFNWDIFKANWQ